MTTIADDYAEIIEDVWGNPNAEADIGLHILEVRASGDHVVVIGRPTGIDATVAYAQPVLSLEQIVAGALPGITGVQPPAAVAADIERTHPGIRWMIGQLG